MDSINTITSDLDFDALTIKDRIKIKRHIRDYERESKTAELGSQENKLQRLQKLIKSAKSHFLKRAEQHVHISYPDDLPVAQKAQEIKLAIETNQVVVVAGETGSGKTTQLPKVCLEAGLGRKGLIGHTQPRRLAARTVSDRIAQELQTELGGQVGYQVRFTDSVSDASLIKVMTDGVLLAEIKNDPYLNRYDAIIIDEAHERSLNIDFILGYLKRLLRKRKDLKVIITSATIDLERFSKHFDNAPVISVSGRSYEVDVKYLPRNTEDNETSLGSQVEEAIELIQEDEHDRQWRIGDVLVFLPGEREIRDVAQHLRHCNWRDTEITPLYARLSNDEQSRIFKSHPGRRIVLATNVAETSITVPGIRYVIDSGVARISRYSIRSKIQRLPIEAISQASANQRKGRCGRVAPGICYRLYAEEDFISRPEFTDPEIMRTNLASVILKMLDVGLGEVNQFPFIDMPETRAWRDGYKLLYELNAVDDNQRLAPLGRKLARLPIDPRLARVILAGVETNCFEEVLIIASALAIQDPRERPAEKQQAADQAHSEYKDEHSDFVSVLNLWRLYEEKRQALSNNQLRQYAKKHFLSVLRMREWRELHRQLLIACKSVIDLKKLQLKAPVSNDETVSEAASSVDYDDLHKAILSGFLGNVGRHDEKREYKGSRNRTFQVFPGSTCAKKKPKWMLSAEIVETQQVWARMNARIEAEWIEPIALHLIKRSWSEPHWSQKQGQVMAFEKVTLYGLEIVAKRRVNYSTIDPVISREIFIRHALVEGEYKSRIEALNQNRALITNLEALEDRTRRRDIVIDEERIYDLYAQAIPNTVVSAPSFEKWYKRADEMERGKLSFSLEQLRAEKEEPYDPRLYPNLLENNGIRFPLSYNFSPGADDDGVSISVPARALKQVTATGLEKIVPGLLREKCVQLIKNLPRTIRKHFVPVPDTVEKIYPKVSNSDEPLLESLSRELKYLRGIEVSLDAWKLELLDPHLRLNIKVIDDAGKTLDEGRDLIKLVQRNDQLIQEAPSILEAQAGEQNDYTDWSFADLPKEKEINQGGIGLKVYPAIEDHKHCVRLIECNDVLQAQQRSRLGLARLYALRLKDQFALLPKVIPDYKKIGLYYAPVGQAKYLYEDLALATVIHHFETADNVYSQQDFEQRWQSRRGDFVDSAVAYARTVLNILAPYHQLMKSLKGKTNLQLALSLGDLKAQLGHLVYDGFLSASSFVVIQNYPRYLDAANIRLEKMSREMGLERKTLPVLTEWWQRYEDRLALHEAQGIYDENLATFRWMIEEQRVSWFAQQLGTAQTVSEKRINKQWDLVKRV